MKQEHPENEKARLGDDRADISDADVEALLNRVSAESAPASPPATPAAFHAAVSSAVAVALPRSEKSADFIPSARPSSGWWSRLFQPAPLIGFAAAAAAVALAAFVFRSDHDRGGDRAAGLVLANSATLLTPGENTGFSAPTFTWTTDNGGAATLMIRRQGDTSERPPIAALRTAFSPVRFNSLGLSETLQPGGRYRVELRAAKDEDRLLASREFITLDSVEQAPVREQELSGVVDQCRQLIDNGRPADAWMLWAELTTTEKKDPRMAELKGEILGGLK